MLQSALGHQRRWGGRLGQALLDLKMISEAVLVETLARKSGFEVARLADLEAYALAQALKLVPLELAQRTNCFPMAADTATLTVAMSDPTNLSVTDELRFRTGRRIKVAIGGDREIAEAIRFHYGADDKAPASIALDLENTGEGLALTEPFEGGSTEDMRAMLEPAHRASARPVPPPPVASAAPAAPRQAVRPPSPAVPSAAPAVAPARAAAPQPPGAVPPVVGRPPTTAVPVARPPGGAPAAPSGLHATVPGAPAAPRVAPPAPSGLHPVVPGAPAAAAPRPAPSGQHATVPGAPAAPRVASPAPSGLHQVVPGAAPAAPRPAQPAAPAPSPEPAAPLLQPSPVPPAGVRPAQAALDAARDALLGAIPRGGFSPGEPVEELTPTPLEEGEALTLESLAEEEMVEGRVPIRELSAKDVAILDALEHLAAGVEDPASPVRPARLAAALLRLLLRKKLVSEAELLDELSRG
ncbi:MAG: general secretion pathway protein GspE [Anaeromyxobacter sp.]|nr:general secretion pathway protein GspE [Anaeromyxobacter sp.]